jgi:tryptophan-rich sensory protein
VGELASKSQLRMSYARWALVTVPLIVFIGFLVGNISGSGFGNPWFDGLKRPTWFPPGWLFPVAWTTLYAMMGLAIAHILAARGASGRTLAIALFLVQLTLNYAWPPTFFLAHKISIALILIIVLLGLAIATTFAFARVRRVAAWLMVPYLAWLSFATLLNYEMDRLNPDAETFAPASPATRIVL